MKTRRYAVAMCCLLQQLLKNTALPFGIDMRQSREFFWLMRFSDKGQPFGAQWRFLYNYLAGSKGVGRELLVQETFSASH